jgi:hypothetical protein
MLKSLVSVGCRATGIIPPHAVLVIESSGIADRRCIPIGRIHADAESWAVISASTVIPASAINPTSNPTTEPASWGRKRVATAEVAAARRSKGVSSAKSSCVAAAEPLSASTGSERRYGTKRCHRSDKNYGREYFLNQIQ